MGFGWRHLIGAAALVWTAALPPAQAGVVVSYQPCDPPSQGGTEICASDPRYVPPATWFSDANGSVSGGGFAGPTAVGAFLSNDRGGNFSVTSNFWDAYTLVGPSSDPITLLAVLGVDGSWSHGWQFSTSSAAFGFLIGSGTYWPAPASRLVSYPGGTGGAEVAYTVYRELTVTPNVPFDLGFQLQISGSFDTLLDFMSTAELGFPDLPQGYYVSSTQGFDGLGSRPDDNAVPEPAAIWLSLTAMALLLPTRRRGRHSLDAA